MIMFAMQNNITSLWLIEELKAILKKINKSV